MEATTNIRHANLPQTPKVGKGWETNYNYTMAQIAREEYTRLYGLLQQMERLKAAGIQEITLKAQTGTVTIAVGSAGEICLELSEQLGNRLAKLEKEIFAYEEDSQRDEADEREGEGPRAEAFAFCMPIRPMSDAEYEALPPEAQRAYLQYGAMERPDKAA